MKFKFILFSFLIILIIVLIDLYTSQMLIKTEQLINFSQNASNKIIPIKLLNAEEVNGLQLQLQVPKYIFSSYGDENEKCFLEDVEFAIKFKNNSKEKINCIFNPFSYTCYSGKNKGGFSGETKTTWSIVLTPLKEVDQNEDHILLGFFFGSDEYESIIQPDVYKIISKRLSNLLNDPKIKKGKYKVQIIYKVESNYNSYWVGQVKTNEIIISIN